MNFLFIYLNVLSQKQIFKVRETWIEVNSNPEQFGLAFYNNLFDLAPELRPMFKTDLQTMAFKFSIMLAFLVNRLNKLDLIEQEINNLAVIHNKHLVKPEHYRITKQALVLTLKNKLARKYDIEADTAWQLAFDTISDILIDAQAKNSS